MLLVLIVIGATAGVAVAFRAHQRSSNKVRSEFVISDSDRMYRLPALGGAPRPILPAGFDFYGDVEWSPDGSQIAFAAGASLDNTGISVVDRAGNDVRNLTDSGAPSGFGAYSPVWAPESSRIAFQQLAGSDGSRIHIFDLQTGRISTVPNLAGTNVPFAWSKSKKIWFVNQDHGRVGTVRPDGTKRHFIPTLPKKAFVSDLSPDERQLVGSRVGGPGKGSLFVVNTDGSHFRSLPHLRKGSEEYGPVWAPDGKSIAFFARFWPAVGNARNGGLWVRNLQTHSVRRVSPLPGQSDWPAVDWIAVT